MRSLSRVARFIGILCVLIGCGAAFGDEDFERMLELYRQTGSANMEQRLREYEALQEMRRGLGERHLPAGSQFDFARESYRRVRSESPGTVDANGCAWTSAGPTNLNGRVTSIAIDPTDNTKIYAATVGGIWRSSTAGRRWQRVSDDFLGGVFGAIAVNPGATNEILAGGGDSNMSIWAVGDGMWWSSDFGAPGSWTKVSTKFNNSIVYRIRYDPAPPHDIYVAASNGVWIGKHVPGAPATIDFTRIGNFDSAAHDLVVDFSATPRVVYASVRIKPGNALGVGIYKWDGNVWEEKDSGIPLSDAETISLAMSPTQPDIMYAKVSQQSDGTLVGIYKTVRGGDAIFGDKDTYKPGWFFLPSAVVWKDDGSITAVPDDIMAWYNRLLEVDPTDPDRVYAGAIRLWMSKDGGYVWEDLINGKDPDHPLVSHGDYHTLAFDPTNPKIIYVGNDGGIDRSTDIAQPKWHWTDVSHGMNITMYYNLTSNRKYPTLIAGGTQDNGTGLTFGNRTWYQPWGCDGYDVGSDADNPTTLYANCNQGLALLGNPVNGTPGFPSQIPWTSLIPRPPVITDDVVAGAALAAGGDDCGNTLIVKTEDGITWTPTTATFQIGAAVAALASAPTAQFQTFLAAIVFKDIDPEKCKNYVGPAWTPFDPYVIRTDDGGATWTPVMGLPTTGAWPSSVAFDPNDKNRSYVTYRNGGARIYMSTGGAYSKIAGSGMTAIPADVRNVVVDPFDSNVLYAATSVGMFRGVITLGIGGGVPTAKWFPFNQGLPDGMEINDLWIDPANGILTMGSFGFGAFRRDIRKEAKCASRMLVVRDCVNDDGRESSPCGQPDPEHPIPDASKPIDGFFKPDDTYAGSAHWWTSRDIRIDVPSKNPPANQIADADSVEFELCPTAVTNCPPQSMIDSSPVAFKEARVYVQVTNRGVEPVSKTRVIALWTKPSTSFESLPETFWTKTFPSDGKCGDLDPGSAWQLVDPVTPCRTIATVTPDLPELARFDWTVPQAAGGGATILTVIESDEDPIGAKIRDENQLAPEEIVPGSRHIALRNLNFKPIKIREIHVPLLWPIDLIKHPKDPLSEIEIFFSKVDLRDAVRIALPAGIAARAGQGSVRRTRITDAALVRQLDELRLDPDNVWEVSGDEASLFIDLARDARIPSAVIATPSNGDATVRVSILQRSRDKILGGSVMLLRPEM